MKKLNLIGSIFACISLLVFIGIQIIPLIWSISLSIDTNTNLAPIIILFLSIFIWLIVDLILNIISIFVSRTQEKYNKKFALLIITIIANFITIIYLIYAISTSADMSTSTILYIILALTILISNILMITELAKNKKISATSSNIEPTLQNDESNAISPVESIEDIDTNK